MKQVTHRIAVHSSGRGLFEITPELRDFQRQSGIRTGAKWCCIWRANHVRHCR
ncbi:MAG: hypothetical protein ACYCWC_10440 [Rhodocyclaceae bacterium]